MSKNVVFKDDVADFTTYSFKPQLQYRRTEIRKTPEQDQATLCPSLMETRLWQS